MPLASLLGCGCRATTTASQKATRGEFRQRGRGHITSRVPIRAVLFALFLATVTVTVDARSAAARDRALSTIRIPDVVGQNVTDAYRRLHRARVRVSIANSFTLENAVHGAPVVTHIRPAPGTPIRRGAAVTIRVRCGCTISS